ncbi:MAG: hypothetical protein ACRDT4_04445 [Micromonosporaceae bacterium]
MHQRNRRQRWIWLAGPLIALLAAVTTAPGAAASEVSSRPRTSASFDADVYAVAYRGNVVYVGGRFKGARSGSASTERSRVAAVDARSGRLLSWAPRTDGAVQAIVVYGESVYLAGDFTRVNDEPRRGLAKVDAATGALDPSFAPAVTGRALALALGHGRLYVGGAFTAVNGEPRSNLAAVSPTTGALDASWRPAATEGDVRAIAVDSSRAYLAGRFDMLNGSDDHRKLAAVHPTTGATDTGFRTRLSVIARDVALGPGGPYAAIGGQGGQLLALNSDGTARWAVTANGDFQAVAVLGETIYAGGHFSEICKTSRTGDQGVCLDGSTPRGRLAAVTAGGGLLGWAPEANSAIGVHAVATSGGLGTVAIGGAFTTLGSGSIEQPYFAYFT